MSENKKGIFKLFKESLAKTGCCGSTCTAKKEDSKNSEPSKAKEQNK